MPVYVFSGTSPLILAFPHVGTDVALPVLQRLNENGRALSDTSWHLDRLYRGLVQDESIVRSNFHRYLCDVNGDPDLRGTDGKQLVAMTPLRDQAGRQIWDIPPSATEMARWRSAFHAPYHAALAAQIARVRAKKGFAVVLNCTARHSKTSSHFGGASQDIGLTTNMGAACDPRLAARIAGMCFNESTYRTVINDNAKSGYTLRAHARPKSNVHVLQIELSMATYLNAEADPWLYDTDKAKTIRELLKNILTMLHSWQPEDF